MRRIQHLVLFFLPLFLIAASVKAQESQDTIPKSTAQAMVASMLLPGMGSFYANANTHALVHAGMHFGSVLVGFGKGSCKAGDCNAVANVSFVAFLVNYGWGIVSAVHDVNAYNAGLTEVQKGSPRTSLELVPRRDQLTATLTLSF